MSNKAFTINKHSMRVWPSGQAIATRGHASIKSTRFADHASYHPQLIDWMRTTAAAGKVEQLFTGACGLKIRNIQDWPLPEAHLIHARALELYRRVTGHGQAITDTSWGNVLQSGDYCFPHSHLRAQASIVYMLDPGDSGVDTLAGRFSFVDPRVEACCGEQPGCMTTPLTPEMPPGTMLIFPAQLVHCVSPYHGQRPRLTLAWNLNDFKIHQPQPWELTGQASRA